MLSSGTLKWRPPCQGPCFYHATFTLDHPADTFLDTSQLGKGMVWINGRPLGRFWNVGPQKALYLPAPFLKAGRNEVVLFDLNGEQGRTQQGLDHPVLDAPIAKEPK
jgi:beta-galactosidase